MVVSFIALAVLIVILWCANDFSQDDDLLH